MKKILSAIFTPFVIYVVLAIIIICMGNRYGISVDEPVQQNYGEYVLKYYTSFGKDTAALSYKDLYLYGPFFEVIVVFFQNIFWFVDKFDIRHIIQGLVGLLGAGGVYKILILLNLSKLPALAASILLILNPYWLGYSFINPKDIPFAVGIIWSLYSIFLLDSQRQNRIRYILFSATLIGLTLSIRSGGFILYLYIFLYFVFDCLSSKKFSNLIWNLKAFFIIVVLSYLIMVLFWPWSHLDHFNHPLLSFLKFNHSPNYMRLFFEGKFIPNSELPWYYLPRYFLLKTPEIVLMGVLLFFTVQHKSIEPKKLFLLSFAFIFPFIYVFIRKPVLYDDMRHFLFIIPIATCMAAIGWITAYNSISGKLKIILLSMFLIVFLHFLDFNIRFWPYQYIYYNDISGGINKNYVLDTWGTFHREMAVCINKYTANELTFQPHKKYTVYAKRASCIRHYVDSRRISITNDIKKADYIIRINNQSRFEQASSSICEVRINGIQLGTFYKNKDISK